MIMDVKQTVTATAVALMLGCGGNHPPPDPTPEPPPTATLAVVVTSDGSPVEGANFDVQWTETEHDGTTNEDGYTAIDGNPLDTDFVVQVTKDGFKMWEAVVRLTENLQIDVKLEALVNTNPPWTGRLRLGPGNRGFVDEAGVYQLPLSLHFGEAFSKWVRDSAPVEGEFSTAKQAGYDGFRFWDTLGYYNVVWANKEVMPWRFYNRDGQWIEATPDYYGKWEGFARATQRYGLTFHNSRGDLNSSSLDAVVGHTNHLASILDNIGWSVLWLAEGNNEDWQNGGFGPSGLRQIIAPFKARGAITALSAPPDASEELAALQLYADSVFYVHGLRRGGFPAILRHIFSIGREGGTRLPPSGVQGEPGGPGSGVSVGQVNDREMLALMAAQSFISKQAWTYMSGCGVFYTCPLSSQPGYWAVPRVRDAMEEFGRDMMTWRLSHRSAGDASLRSDCVLEDGDCRVDQAIAGDGRVAATAYNRQGTQRVRNVTSRTLTCDIIGVNDDETLSHATVTLPPDQSVPLSYRVGRLLLCNPN